MYIIHTYPSRLDMDYWHHDGVTDRLPRALIVGSLQRWSSLVLWNISLYRSTNEKGVVDEVQKKVYLLELTLIEKSWDRYYGHMKNNLCFVDTRIQHLVAHLHREKDIKSIISPLTRTFRAIKLQLLCNVGICLVLYHCLV